LTRFSLIFIIID